jgi:hypothetical protein
MAEVKNFLNYTEEDFIGKWDNVERLIKAGESINLPGFLADHYAKHLVDREMIKAGQDISLNIAEARKPFLDKCFIGEAISAPTELEAEIASLNQPVKEEVVEKVIEDVKPVETEGQTTEFSEVI